MSPKNGELLLLGQTSEYSTKKPADFNIIQCRVDMLHSLSSHQSIQHFRAIHCEMLACLSFLLFLFHEINITSHSHFYQCFHIKTVSHFLKNSFQRWDLILDSILKRQVVAEAVLRLGWVTKETLYCIIQGFFMPDCQVDVRGKGEYSE